MIIKVKQRRVKLVFIWMTTGEYRGTVSLDVTESNGFWLKTVNRVPSPVGLVIFTYAQIHLEKYKPTSSPRPMG